MKLEENSEEEDTNVEMTRTSDVAISLSASCDMSQGDDVVSSTSDVFSCDYEGFSCFLPYFCSLYIKPVYLCIVHTADTDKTRLSCLLVLSCPCRRCEQNWRQVKTVGDRKFQNCFVQSRNAV